MSLRESLRARVSSEGAEGASQGSTDSGGAGGGKGSLKRQFSILVALGVVALVVVSIASVTALFRAGATATDVGQRHKNAEQLLRLEAAESELNVGGASVLSATPAEYRMMMDNVQASIKGVHDALAGIESDTFTPAGQQMYAELKTTLEAELAGYNKAIEMVGADGKGALAAKTMFMTEVLPLRAQFSE